RHTLGAVHWCPTPGGAVSTGAAAPPATFGSWIVRAGVATQWLVLGLGTALLALLAAVTLAAVVVPCLVAVGVLFLPLALRLGRWVADLERRRLTAMGHSTTAPHGPVPTGWAETLRTLRSDVSARRD